MGQSKYHYKLNTMSTTTTVTAKRFSLQLNDWWKGLIVAVISPVFTILITSLNAGSLVFDWKAIGAVALAAGMSYVMKNLLDKPKIIVMGATPEMVQAVKQGEAKVKVDGIVAETKQ